MINILLTNCNDTGENLLVYAPEHITSCMLEKALRIRGFLFTDCFQVPDNDLQYYCIDDRMTLTPDLVAVVERLSA